MNIVGRGEGRKGPLKVSITGIDGAGKDTVARESLVELSARRDLSVMKLGRPAYGITNGTISEEFQRTNGFMGMLNERFNSTGSLGLVMAANALNMVTQTRVMEPFGARREYDVIASSRDPILDPTVYFDFYGGALARWVDYRARASVMKGITGVERDLIVLLQVDPETAIQRIESRLATEQADQSATRPQQRHLHENPKDLAEIAAAYEQAISDIRSLGNATIVRVDTNDKHPDTVTGEVADAIWASYTERRGRDRQTGAAR